MKLLYFIPGLYNSGGTERVLTEKVNYLVENYPYEISIVTTEQLGRPVFYDLRKQIKTIHLDIDFASDFNKRLDKRIAQHYKKLSRYEKEINTLLSNLKPDICISLGGKEIEFLYKIKTDSIKIIELHFPMNFREQFLKSRKKNFIWNLLGKYRTKQLIKQTRSVDKLVVLTKTDQEIWSQTNNNVTYIYNPSPISTENNANIKSKKIIAVGRLEEEKGYDYLIEIWKNVSKKNPDWTLDIWGMGSLYNYLQNKIEESNLSSIHLRGLTNDIAKEYISSSISVLTSLYEGLPMVLIESMSCGIPAVSFDCDFGPREIITNKIDGYLVPVKDITSFTEKLNELIENEELRMNMSEQAKMNASRFDKKVIMKSWDKLFHELTKKSS